MSLAERLDVLEQRRQFLCKYARALAAATEAEPEQVEAFTDAVDAGTLQLSEWTQILTEEGFPVSESVARRHLQNRRCGCTA